MTKRSTPCHCCHLCVGVFMPVFGCVCVYVCTPLGTRQTVQTFCSQGQTHQGPEGFLTVLLVGRVPIVLYFYWQRIYIILFSFICSKTIFSPPHHEWTHRFTSCPSSGWEAVKRLVFRKVGVGLLLACCLRCWRPHWNTSWVSERETTSLINQESPHSLFTVSPSNSSEPRATTHYHQCCHWLSGLISVCLACQINAFLTVCHPCRRPQMNISCPLWSNHNSKHITQLTLLLLSEALLCSSLFHGFSNTE